MANKLTTAVFLFFSITSVATAAEVFTSDLQITAFEKRALAATLEKFHSPTAEAEFRIRCSKDRTKHETCYMSMNLINKGDVKSQQRQIWKDDDYYKIAENLILRAN